MKIKRILVLCLAILFISVACIENKTFANTERANTDNTNNYINIIKANNDRTGNKTTENEKVSISGSRYALIRISNNIEKNSDVLGDVQKKFQDLSISQIEEKYKSFGKLTISNPTDDNGKTTIGSLESGLYYISEVRYLDGKLTRVEGSVPFLVNIFKDTSGITIYPKHVKVSSDKKTDDEIKKDDIIKNNIGKSSEEKKPSHIIKTGDDTIFFIVGIGLILMSVGYKIYKSPQKIYNKTKKNW